MALYVMGDLHLSFSTQKPMDIFGEEWTNHAEKIQARWPLTPVDTVVVPGDLSWAADFSQLYADLTFLDNLPGQKIISKGNHDYWWNTLSKLTRFAQSFSSIRFLHNNSYEAEGVSICGTRGWTMGQSEEDEKILRREAGRLRLSLQTATLPPVVFLHYPPLFAATRCGEIMDVLSEFQVQECYYGHLHGARAIALAQQGNIEGIHFSLVSADYLNFIPKKIRPLHPGSESEIIS